MPEQEHEQEQEATGQTPEHHEPMGPPRQPPLNWSGLVRVISERRIDAAMYFTRALTIFFTFAYMFPIFGSPTQCYYKAFMASAATSALRLHQRIPHFGFSMAFFQQMVQEDSFHYLFCCLIFLYANPLTLALAPTALFAILHFASFSMALLEAVGRGQTWIARGFMSLIEHKSVQLLRMAAGAEICIMSFIILYVLMGRQSLFTPFLYFRFLTFRYASRRNHYTRTMFYEFRLAFERIAMSGSCPAIVAKGIRSGIQLVGKLAPPYATTQTN